MLVADGRVASCDLEARSVDNDRLIRLCRINAGENNAASKKRIGGHNSNIPFDSQMMMPWINSRLGAINNTAKITVSMFPHLATG